MLEGLNAVLTKLTGWEFIYPLCLLMGLVAALVMAGLYIWRRQQQEVTPWPCRELFDLASGNYRSTETPRHLLAIAMIGTVLALSVPGARPTVETSEEIDLSVVIFVYDGSDSMDTDDIQVPNQDETVSRWQAAIWATLASADSIPRQTTLRVMSYGTEGDQPFAEPSAPTTKSGDLVRLIEDLPRGGQTPTDYALERSYESACKDYVDFIRQNQDENSDYPCTIILLTDGLCDSPSCPSDMNNLAAAACQNHGIITHAVGWGPAEGSDRDVRKSSLKAVADRGCGEFFDTDQLSELTRIYSDIIPKEETKKETEPLSFWVVVGAWVLMVWIFF